MSKADQRVIGLCGTQGTGKSTILKGLYESNFPIDSSQISRTVQKNLGWDTLARAQESVENMMALQNGIYEAMFERDLAICMASASTTPICVVVDRTPADVWAYTEMWCNRVGINYLENIWCVEYKQKLVKLAQSWYAKFIIVPPIPEIPFIAEPNRADEASRMFVANAINRFIYEYNLPSFTVKSSSREDRLCDVEAVYMVTNVTQKSRVNEYRTEQEINRKRK